MFCEWIQQVLQKVEVSVWMKTEVLVESFYIMIELTDPFPYMTPVSGLIHYHVLPACPRCFILWKNWIRHRLLTLRHLDQGKDRTRHGVVSMRIE